MGLYLRDLPGITLRTVADELNTANDLWGGATTDMDVRVDGERLVVRFGDHEVPATADGVGQLTTFFDIPRPWFARSPLAMQEFVLRETIRNNPANLSVRYDEGGISEVFKPDAARIEPRQVADVAIRVLGEDAEVVQWRADSDELFFDLVAPEGNGPIGGEPGTGERLGDITRGGLRFHQNRKNNHSPEVASYLYRLRCTNGMSVPDEGLKLDARGASVNEVLAELELMAQRAFGQVEEQIAHFYEMRDQPIQGDVTQAVIRTAQERGLPNRTAMTLAQRVPAMLNESELGHPPTMFDLANLFTNQANDPSIANRRNARLALETAGGTLVQEHRDRCGTCYQAL